ncbi:cyclic nucleotide-binding domain-containing protein [Mucilaginibacter sp. ZT4R22]|uniref:Cyclic nucleotide-binding domain-containing protein n=1 Tax=Mucilaginibacter pankratovii TaxID=2772110 RepID=A0ABR7WST2_9SPHI|nr:cyclic nucleotide-binding domain-containing protein [Mucilaginibacter pankratovii]MBD1365316.1 cyclic nucleotide-binding domain-containing protein [Mucilaginibacter pankratovii]
MIHLLRQHIQTRLGNDVSGLEDVLTTFKERHIKRGELVVRQGENCDHVYYIASGCLQVFVYDADVNETTRDIVIEDNWCADLISFGGSQPATENIKAVEPCILLAINRADFYHLMQTVPQFDKVYRQILEASYANSVYRINTFVSLSALDRIKWLMDYRPKLMSRLSSKLIASYLGISQETFSRLKAKI